MGNFIVQDMTLQIPDRCLVPNLEKALNSGLYESTESAALKRHLREDDRFVDLGAGAGFLCTLAAQVVGAEKVMGVEANPDMAPAAQSNIDRNAGPGSQVLEGAVVPDDFEGVSVTFLKRHGFWAGLIDTKTANSHADHVTVPALKISKILAEHRPTLVSIDIEGSEVDLADYSWPGFVRLIIMEIHTKRYKPNELKSIFTGLFSNGFDFCPRGSHEETLVFKRPSKLRIQ